MIKLLRSPSRTVVGVAHARAWCANDSSVGYQLWPVSPAAPWGIEGRHLFRFPDGTEQWLRVGRMVGPEGLSDWLDAIPVSDGA